MCNYICVWSDQYLCIYWLQPKLGKVRLSCLDQRIVLKFVLHVTYAYFWQFHFTGSLFTHVYMHVDSSISAFFFLLFFKTTNQMRKNALTCPESLSFTFCYLCD